MALMSKPTHDPKLTRWWWRTLREWVYELIDPLWGAFRGENTDEITLANVTDINGVSTAELAILDGITATTAELNKLGGLTADATDLNKTDRAQADGVAEASKVVVLDANKDLLDKRFDINRSLLEGTVRGPGLHLDGANAEVTIPHSTHIDFPANDFTLVFVLKPDTNDADIWIGGKRQHNGNVPGWYLAKRVSDGWWLSLNDGTNGLTVKYAGDLPTDQPSVLVYVVDRVNLTAHAYLNGVESTSISGSFATLGSLANSQQLELGWFYDQHFKGNAYYHAQFNRALSVDEVKALTSGAPLGFVDVGASQTDRVINGDAWTGASGSTPPNSWSDSGSGTAGYSIRDNSSVANMDSDTLELAVIGSGSKTLDQTMLQPGKRYRVSFAYRNLDGTSSTIVALGTSANSVTLQNTGISGDGVLFEQELVADGTDLLFVVDVDGILQIDKMKVVQIGCVAEFRPDGMTAAQWQDTSGNQLHGAVDGATPINLPSNHVARYVKTAVTGDTVLTDVLPAGYRIKSIVVEETAGNAITGGLKIGTSAGGTQVVNGQAVGANALVDCAPGTVIFSISAAQTLYVEDVTSWNSASIDLWIQMERVS